MKAGGNHHSPLGVYRAKAGHRRHYLLGMKLRARLQGYTDSRGSSSRNLDLSQRRAEAVRSYLVSRGVPSDRIVAKGMGPDRPVADNTSAEGRAQNRRVEIVVAK